MIEIKKAKNNLRLYSLFAFLSIIFSIIWLIADVLYHKNESESVADVLTIIGFVLTIITIFMTISFAISAITLKIVAEGKKAHILVPLVIIVISFIVADLIQMIQKPFGAIPCIVIMMLGCLYSSISGLVLASKVE